MRQHIACGRIRCEFDLLTGWLWHVSIDEVEVLQALYPAVRDRDWITVPSVVKRWELRSASGAIELSVWGVCRNEEIELSWTGEVLVSSKGVITYTYRARAQRSFWKNRIGLCVHLPAACAGAPARAVAPDGTIVTGALPRVIAPHQPFRNLQQFEFSFADGHRCLLVFEGDLFEMEDQRNWTDASYKIYSTPLDLPFPVQVREGEEILQSVTAVLEPTELGVQASDVVEVDCDVAPLPPLSLGTQLPPLDEMDELTALARCVHSLHPAHLRVDWYGGDRESNRRLQSAIQLAHETGVPLLVAIFATDDDIVKQELIPCFSHAKASPPILGWMVFDPMRKVTPSELLTRLAEPLRQCVPAPIVAGTDYFFAELNREPYPWPEADWVSFSVTPGVHALDDENLLLNATVQDTAVQCASMLSGRRPVLVSPITLRMRKNPNATAGIREVAREEQVDARLRNEFGAGWLLQSVNSLVHAQPVAATYFELFGPLGLLEAPVEAEAAGAGGESTHLNPTALVFQWLTKRRGENANWLPVRSSRPTSVQGMGLTWERDWELMLVNPGGEGQLVTLRSIPGTIESLQILNGRSDFVAPIQTERLTIVLPLPSRTVLLIRGSR